MKRHIVRSIVLCLVTLPALAASLPAAAAPRPDDRTGVHGPGTQAAPPVVRPDDRAGVRAAAAAPSAARGSAFAWGEAGAGGVAPLLVVSSRAAGGGGGGGGGGGPPPAPPRGGG